jgi:hypothetical protein
MDAMTTKDLMNFLHKHSGWHISLFMPTHQAGREVEQNIIRFKNLLQESESRLLAKGLRKPDVRELLQPAQSLLDKPGFWQHQSHGLAVFLTLDTFDYFRLPISFEQMVIISDSFHLKPLLPFFNSDGHFYILALSQNQIRLMEGTRHSVDEINLDDLPESMAEALQNEHFFKDTQFHTGTSTTRGGDRAGMYHGHDPSDESKSRILRWFHQINDAIPGLLLGEKSPMVLAGVEFLFPLYKQANTYPHLVEEGIPGNPEELSSEELHAQAWPLVQPRFLEAQENAVARFYQMSGTDQATTDIAQAVLTAHHGRIADLIVAINQHIWGVYDPEQGEVHIHQEKQPGDRDLLDLAAMQTILTGGAVYALEPEQIPNKAPLAAVFRY